jgi:hypothetical protein
MNMRASVSVICAVVALFPPMAPAETEWGRNPFVFGKKAETRPEKSGPAKPEREWPSVEMAIVQGNMRFAVVNGRKAAIGDSVDGAIISDITMESVTFVKNGRTFIKSVGEMDDAP